MPRPIAHPPRLVVLLASAAILLAACGASGGPGASPSGPGPGSPSAPVPADPSPSDPGAAIDVDTLLGDAPALDGQRVRVTGNFLADETEAQLCALLMESYPPQCGGGVRLTGEVPGDVLAVLDTTTEPDLKKMWWGYVTVVGTFRAAGADGQPTIELETVELQEG